MYIIKYDLDGKPCSIKDGNMIIPIEPMNGDFSQFLEWNKAQKKPLDYETSIVVKPRPEEEPAETLEEKIAKEVKKQLGKK